MVEPARTSRWEWWFDAPPSVVWPLVSDTNRLDRLAGLPPATYARAKVAGRPHVLAVSQRFGGFALPYEEEPYEWVEEERYAVERRFAKGPVTRFRWRVRLVPDARGTTVVAEISLSARSRLHALLLGAIARGGRRGMDRAFAVLQAEASGTPPDRPARRQVQRRALARLEAAGAAIPPEDAARLAAHLASADASDLRRVRPFALADAWRRPRRDVLASCLGAVRAGVLELGWETLCPHCRRPEGTASSLGKIRAANRCDACGIDFDADFDRSLEAVFRPAADLRTVGPEVYCLGGPGSTPHVVAQARAGSGDEVRLSVRLDAGAYRIRGARREGAVVVHAEADPALPAALSASVGDRAVTASAAAVAAGRVDFALRNAGTTDAVLVVERLRWLDDVATALDVVSIPGFRDLFTHEVLAPGERVAVRRIAILFTDLRGSTSIYRRVGDAAAYALVREHFRVLRDAIRRRDGMLVKTIGDAVMAAFRSPADAVAAALDMHRAVAALPAPDGVGALVLKAGVHQGPSIVVNASGLLDFFGTTSNLAARAQHESRGHDLVATSAIVEDADVRRLLARIPHRDEPFRATPKGFDEEVILHRLVVEDVA